MQRKALMTVLTGSLVALLSLPALCLAETGVNPADLQYRVGFLGCPAYPNVPWTKANVERLKALGFNAVQLNIAWGARPADEPLNLEDVVDLPAELADKLGQPVPLGSDPNGRARREADLQHRIQVAKEVGLRTIFHFGAPYNGQSGYAGRPLANCLLDGKTPERYVALLKAFAAKYPGVDDILIYTYDQDAWLCDEFHACERCRGIPLHERAVPFLNRLAGTWRQLRPDGRLWWEPWELSAGQVLACIERVNPKGFGLALHSNIAEVMATLPVDRWLKNACHLASGRDIPVIVECWLGGESEEWEPYIHFAHPLVTWRALQSIAAVPGVVGIKEYYGLIPDRVDVNLAATGRFFADPSLSETRLLTELAKPYGPAGKDMQAFWQLTSEAMELFPWDTSWFIREIGKCDPSHTMNAAFLRGQQCHTPSWESTRSAIFMKTDSRQPDPWMLEDVQIRCDLAAQRMSRALELGKKIAAGPLSYGADEFAATLDELAAWRQRALSYVYHIRETNLLYNIRYLFEKEMPIPDRMMDELQTVLMADQANQGQDEPIASALNLLQTDMDAFLKKYFLPVTGDTIPKGHFSLTSH